MYPHSAKGTKELGNKKGKGGEGVAQNLKKGWSYIGGILIK